MPALPVDFDPYNPIPNNPFYSLPTNYLQGPFGPLVIGSGLLVSAQGVISAAGGGGGGTVTAVTAGAGLAGGTITSTGTISLAATGVTAGAYVYPALSVDSFGRITSISSGSPMTSVSVNSPLISSGPATSPTLSIQPATTSTIGAVQLNNTTSSTLTNQALTAAAGKDLQDQINALASSSGSLILAGTFDAATGNVVTATTAGISVGITSGNPLPAPSAATDDYYLIVTTAAASYTPPGSPVINSINVGDYIFGTGGIWDILRVGPITGAYATTTTAGVVELATSAEAIAGTDPNVVLTPFTGAATYVNRYCFTGPGQLLASNGNATYSALGSGIDGFVLTADSSAPLGVKWAAGGGGSTPTINMTFSAPLNATTNPYVGGVVGVGIDAASTVACGAVQLADVAATQAGVSSALALTPLGAASTYIPFCDFTTKGQLIVGTGAGTFAIQSAGADGCALVACAACANGLTYANPLAVATPSTLGAFCGYALGTGGNVSVGGASLANIGAGVANTALGASAATSMTTGNANIAIGSGALALETAGSCNVAVGTCALYTSAGGVGNTALGTAAGDLVTTGDCNTFVGFDAGATTTTGNNQVVIGASGTASTAAVNNEVSIYGGTTVARFAQGAVAWTFTSDARRKENIEDLALGLDFVSELQPRSFDWKEDGKHAAGFIAQEVDAVVEKFDADYLGAVSKADPECYTVAQAALIPVLVNAIKELKAEVAELKKKLG
jgi:hypothetical protein